MGTDSKNDKPTSIEEFLARTGYKVDDLVLHFRNSDQGSGLFNSDGRADLKLNSEELFDAFSRLAEAGGAGKIDPKEPIGRQLKTALDNSVGKEGIDVNAIEEVIRSSDANEDGRVTFQELGVSPQMLENSQPPIDTQQSR